MSIQDLVDSIFNKVQERKTQADAQGGDWQTNAQNGITNTVKGMFTNPNQATYNPFSGQSTVNSYNNIMMQANKDRVNKESQEADQEAGIYTFNEATDAFNKRMAEENPDFKQRSWFEYQTEASPEELWELLTSEEMGKILSQEYVDNVLHDYDNTFLNWVNQQKADNTVDKFIGSRATNNIYDIVEQPDMNKFVDWAIKNNQVEPLDYGVHSVSGSPNSPAMRAAMAGQFLEQAGRYGVPLSEDVLNEQVKLVDPTLIGKYVAKDDRDRSVLQNQIMLDGASTDYAGVMGVDPKIAKANAKAAAAMADQGMYVYDPDADLSNVALRAALLRDTDNMQGVYQLYDYLNDSPDYQSIYDESPVLYDEIDKLGSYMTDDSYARAKEQSRKDFENLIATIANNQGYYYRGGN